MAFGKCWNENMLEGVCKKDLCMNNICMLNYWIEAKHIVGELSRNQSWQFSFSYIKSRTDYFSFYRFYFSLLSECTTRKNDWYDLVTWKGKQKGNWEAKTVWAELNGDMENDRIIYIMLMQSANWEQRWMVKADSRMLSINRDDHVDKYIYGCQIACRKRTMVNDKH